MPVSTADVCWLVMSRSGLGPGTCPRTGRPEQRERCRAGQGWADLRLRSRPVQEADGKRRPSEGQGKILISLKMLRFLVEWADGRWELRTRGTRGTASKPWPSMIRMNDFMTRLRSTSKWTSANQACLRRVGLVNQPKSEVAQVILSTPVLSIVLQEHLPHCPSRSERRLRGWPDLTSTTCTDPPIALMFRLASLSINSSAIPTARMRLLLSKDRQYLTPVSAFKPLLRLRIVCVPPLVSSKPTLTDPLGPRLSTTLLRHHARQSVYQCRIVFNAWDCTASLERTVSLERSELLLLPSIDSSMGLQTSTLTHLVVAEVFCGV